MTSHRINFSRHVLIKLTWSTLLVLLLQTVTYVDAHRVDGAKNQKIVLNMIVKNEKPVIERCLASTLGLIDHYVIADTGSTDGTQQAILGFFKKHRISGELHQHKWVNFAHNRNLALQAAYTYLDNKTVKGNKLQNITDSAYVMFLDADEYFVVENESFKLPNLMDKTFYYVKTKYSNLYYDRIQFISMRLKDWKWVSPVHEVVDSPSANTVELLPNVHVHVTSEGNSWTNSNKYREHAAMLEVALAEDPKNSRNQFYYAQSWRDCQENEKAIEAYRKRSNMGGWEEEVYISLYEISRLEQIQGRIPFVFVESYLRAYKFRPTRIESIYFLVRYYNRIGNYVYAFNFAKMMVETPMPKDSLFVDNWIYQTGRFQEMNYTLARLDKNGDKSPF